MTGQEDRRETSLLADLDAAAGRATFFARNLSQRNLRWVIVGLGGGVLAIWLLSEIADFVLALIELQLKYR